MSSNLSARGQPKAGLSVTHQVIRIMVWILFPVVWVAAILLLIRSAQDIYFDGNSFDTISPLVVSTIVVVILLVGVLWRVIYALIKIYRRSGGSDGGIRVQAYELYRTLREPEGQIQI